MAVIIPNNSETKPKPSEQWAVRNLRLPSDQAIAKIQEDDRIPDEDKAFLIAKIKKSGFAGVVVDAQDHFHDGITVGHWSVTKLY